MGKTVGRIPHTIQGSKGPRNKLNHFHGLQYHRNINIPKGTANHRVRTQCIGNRHSTENNDNMVWSRCTKGSTRQYTYIRWKTRRTEPVLEHHRIVLHHVQDTQNRLGNAAIQRKSTRNHTTHVTRKRRRSGQQLKENSQVTMDPLKVE